MPKVKAILYISISAIYALLYALSVNWLLPVPFGILFFDGVVHAVLLVGMGILLSNIVKYGYYKKLLLFLQIVNHIALACFCILIVTGTGYLFHWIIFSENTLTLLISTIPLNAFFCLLLYIILILFLQSNNKEAIQTSEEEYITETIPQKEIETGTTELLERIVVKTGQKIEVIPISEVLYLQSDGDYVQIISSNGKYLKEQTMKYFEIHLPVSKFVRVHRSYIVNVEAISRIELYTKQNQLITLKNGEQLKVSAAGYKMLRMTLEL